MFQKSLALKQKLAMAALWGLATISRADLGPENVAVVVNGDSWASKTVANHYVHLRGIPAINVIYLSDVPGFEQTDVETFRQKVLGPVTSAIARRGLQGQIDCIAYSCDFPFAVDLAADIQDKPQPQVITPVGSLTGLTYLHSDVAGKKLGYLRLDANRYARRELPLRKPTRFDEAGQAAVAEAERLYREKKHVEAAAAFASLAARHPNDANLHYNLACCMALSGRPAEAIAALKQAVAAGWRNSRHALGDEDLKPVRDDPEFQRLIEQMKSAPVTLQPALGFRSGYQWNEAGEISSNGKRYTLSTVLGVTSGRGNSLQEVIDCLTRSAAADGARPKGTVYLLQNHDVRSGTRDWAFKAVAEELEKLGVRAQIDEGVLPGGKSDVAGAVIGAATFDWKASGSRILPGAICEHLTSTGGVLQEGADQTPCTEFIRHGAAGTCGTVTEPYAVAEKFPSAFVHVHYARGLSLAEAFYQSVSGPYQLLVIGDPLCRPWTRPGKIVLRDFHPGSKAAGVVEMRAGFEPAESAPISYELFADGVTVASALGGDLLRMDTTQLPDGYHELSIVSTGGDPVESRHRLSFSCEVNNHKRRVRVESLRKPEIEWEAGEKIEAQCEGATQLALMHNGRTVDTCRGPRGKLDIDPQAIGPGPVKLFVVATFGGKTEAQARSSPINLLIKNPKPRPPMQPDSAHRAEKGLLLSIGDRKQTIADARGGEWLAAAGAKTGDTFELTGWFDAADELWQLQVHTNVPLKIDASGAKLELPPSRQWQYHPLAFQPGAHRLHIRGVVGRDAPRLDIRFGNAGTQRLSAGRFTSERP